MSDLKEEEIDPGYYWKIEGYAVFKVGFRFEATYCGSYLCSARTLDEIRDEIRSAVYGPVR